MKFLVPICLAFLAIMSSVSSQGEDGCYVTECLSKFTYSYKCRPDFTERQAQDDGTCKGSFTKYMCCPDATGDSPINSEINQDAGSNSGAPVIPQPV